MAFDNDVPLPPAACAAISHGLLCLCVPCLCLFSLRGSECTPCCWRGQPQHPPVCCFKPASPTGINSWASKWKETLMRKVFADRLCCEKMHSAGTGGNQPLILGSEGRRFTVSPALDSGCCRAVGCVPAAGAHTSPQGSELKPFQVSHPALHRPRCHQPGEEITELNHLL